MLAILSLWLITNRQKHDPSESGDFRKSNRQVSTKDVKSNAITQQGKTVRQEQAPDFPAQTLTPADDLEQIIKTLGYTAITYDPIVLPKIEPYLLHPEPKIREAAVDAMLTIGDASAAPLLRKAAKNAPSPQEAVELIEAADFLELPPARLKLKKIR